jgi:hypothetical protein
MCEKPKLSFASRRIIPRVLAMPHTYSALNLAWGPRVLRCRFSASPSVMESNVRMVQDEIKEKR